MLWTSCCDYCHMYDLIKHICIQTLIIRLAVNLWVQTCHQLNILEQRCAPPNCCFVCMMKVHADNIARQSFSVRQVAGQAHWTTFSFCVFCCSLSVSNPSKFCLALVKNDGKLVFDGSRLSKWQLHVWMHKDSKNILSQLHQEGWCASRPCFGCTDIKRLTLLSNCNKMIRTIYHTSSWSNARSCLLSPELRGVWWAWIFQQDWNSTICVWTVSTTKSNVKSHSTCHVWMIRLCWGLSHKNEGSDNRLLSSRLSSQLKISQHRHWFWCQQHCFKHLSLQH